MSTIEVCGIEMRLNEEAFSFFKFNHLLQEL